MQGFCFVLEQRGDSLLLNSISLTPLSKQSIKKETGSEREQQASPLSRHLPHLRREGEEVELRDYNPPMGQFIPSLVNVAN